MSMFDFDLDGIQELVYRDQDSLRIIDKDGNNRIRFVCKSGTHTEYPIVVDADGDGHAEIYVSGGASADAKDIKLMKFDAGAVNNWAPARKVWPQHGYNPVYINDDLTFPAQPLPQTTAVASPSGVVRRPFNNYLQQVGPTNLEGKELCLAPDLAFEVNKNQIFSYDSDTDVATVTASVTNEGSISYTGDIRLSLFAIQSSGDYQLIGEQTYAAQTLQIAEYRSFTLDVNNYLTVVAGLGKFAWLLTLNMLDQSPAAPVPPDNVSGAALVQECNYNNNLGKKTAFISGSLILCQGEQGLLNIEPANTYDCRWYESNGTTPYNGTDANNTGDSKTVNKPTANWRDAYVVEVWTKTGAATMLSVDTVYLYLPSDTLVWTGAHNSDWHDVRNWDKPGDDERVQVGTYTPRGCTNVLIPDGLATYPDLSLSSTTYTVYSDAACGNIHFAHGGEVFASDRLTYDKAYIEVDMLGNRWYCFSPPLRDFYSGDIYVNNPNPFYDYNLDDSQLGMFIYTHLFSQTDPQIGYYTEGGWGRTFNTPNYSFASGQGVGVWIDDLEPNRAIHNAVAFHFPKDDAGYFIYKADGSLENGPHLTPRTNSHRFIFEDAIDAFNNVKLSPEATSAGKSILVGNPFMAHLDFNAFYDYTANNSLIENYYRVINADGNYSTYRRDGVTTGSPVLTNLIAPMQSFIVEARSVFPSRTLVANSSMSGPGSGKLRSAAENRIATPKHLRVSVGDTKIRGYAALVYDETLGATTAYDADADVYKVLKAGAKAIPNVYFITSDDRYMDIKTLSNLQDVTLRIGICGTQTGNLSLGFERIWEFYDDHAVYLIDKELNKTVDVRISPRYNFVKSTADTFLNDRFELQFVKKDTGIDNVKAPAVQKTVVSKSYYDLSGRPVSEHAAKGFLIQKSVYDDGTTGYGKTYVK
jgi:hypothetical protein